MQIRDASSYGFAATAAICVLLGPGPATAAQVALTPTEDASIYEYEYGTYVSGLPDTYPKADGTGHLHVGDANNRNGVQRGLIRFDFDQIPADATVTDVRLTMVVADVANWILQRDVSFWMVAVEGLSHEWDWSEGPGNEQSPAVQGDTTWFHTRYDPAEHGQLGGSPSNPFHNFNAAADGYWPAAGYFGQEDLLETAPGEGAGGPFDDAHALTFHEGTVIGDVVRWSNPRMLGDVQAWAEGSKDNFGWILIGEEWITGEQQVVRPDNNKLANASSKIDFFSSQTAAPYYAPPVLSVTYTPVPEPGCVALLLCGVAALFCRRRIGPRRKRLETVT